MLLASLHLLESLRDCRNQTDLGEIFDRGEPFIAQLRERVQILCSHHQIQGAVQFKEDGSPEGKVLCAICQKELSARYDVITKSDPQREGAIAIYICPK